jgi:hypothetical protein
MGSLIGSLILEGVIRSGWPVTPLQGRGPNMAVLGPLCWCDVALGQGVLVLSRPAPRRSIIVLQYIFPLPQTGHADVLVPVVLVWV